jgi:predicted lipoprotein with Yx(FWY)xxD motif
MTTRSLPPLFLLFAVAAPLPAQETSTAVADKLPSHPGEVALVDEGSRGTVYRRFPGGQRLYTFDRDPPGQSSCNYGCSSAWPPVPAPSDAAPVGDWSIVVRADGTRQWALKGKPVYTRFHDAPDKPGGDGLEGVWRLIPYTSAPVNPTPAGSVTR